MSLRSTGRSKERVLLYGMEGTGKSLAALDVAAAISPATMYVIDNDNAWDRMLEGQTLGGVKVEVAAEYRWDGKRWDEDNEYVKPGGNIVVYHASGWEANTSAIAEVREAATANDWCCIDSGTALWSDVSDYFVDQVFNQSKADYFLKARIAMEKPDASDGPMLDGWKDYGIINPIYNEGVMTFLILPPCHLLVTAEEEQVKAVPQKGKDIEGKETRAMYGEVQYKPRGQKRLGHNVQTVLRLARRANDRYTVNTVKDRGGRDQWDGEEVTGRGFSEWYLEETAGWVEETSTPSPTAKTAPIAKKGMVSKS